jgi:hypothetical protein
MVLVVDWCGAFRGVKKGGENIYIYIYIYMKLAEVKGAEFCEGADF